MNVVMTTLKAHPVKNRLPSRPRSAPVTSTPRPHNLQVSRTFANIIPALPAAIHPSQVLAKEGFNKLTN